MYKPKKARKLKILIRKHENDHMFYSRLYHIMWTRRIMLQEKDSHQVLLDQARVVTCVEPEIETSGA